MQYSTCYWPLARITRIIKSCLEMHSKACQWHEIISVLSELWASRSWYKSGQLKATRILRQHKGIAEVLQSCLIFLMQACFIDFRGGSSCLLMSGWFSCHQATLLYCPSPSNHHDFQTKTVFCLHSKNSDPVLKLRESSIVMFTCSQTGKVLEEAFGKRTNASKAPSPSC